MIRPTIDGDAEAIMAMIEDSGQFDADGLAYVRSTLDEHLSGSGGGIWLTADDGEPVGVAYCTPEPATSGTWNLLMLWTRSDRHGRGHGSALVDSIEAAIRAQDARLLIVETSGLPAFESARAFYARCGFHHEATIADFFAAGDAKLVYTKSMVRS